LTPVFRTEQRRHRDTPIPDYSGGPMGPAPEREGDMAKVIETMDSTMLTVEMGVGAGRANNRDDVTLVQYLLNLYFQHPNQARVRQLGGTAASRKLVVDGIIGPRTNAAILAFQNAICATDNARVICDGRVDKLRNEQVVVKGSDMQLYTIFELNNYAYALYLEDEDITGLRFRSDFPSRLVPIVNRFLPAWARWNAA